MSMRRVRIVLSRLRGILAGRRLDRELQDEIAGHLAEAIEDFVTQGLSPEEARRAALCSFGGVTQTIETHRDARGWPWFESILRDVRRAIRLLRRSPGVTAAAVLSLALGMGGTTTMFSLVNGLMLRPLPVQNPERLVSIVAGEETNSWKMPVWERLRDRAGLFDGLFAWDARSLDLAERGESRPVSGLLVSGSFFDVLGLSPQAGRLLRRTDDVQGGGSDGPAAVISDGFWRHQFGAAPDVVGRTLRVNGASVTIVGIAPASFFGPEVGRSFDVAVPLAIAPLFAPESPPEMAFRNLWLSIMARLKPGQDAAGATATLQAVMPGVLDAADTPLPRYMRLPASLRASMATARVEPAPGGPSLVRDQYDRSVVTVTAIALAVLLIACVNLANLFLARGEARRRELAIAVALGATRHRLVRQLVIEGLVLSALGAAGGLAIAMWAAPVLIGEFSSARHAVTMALPIDWRLLGLTGLTAIATTLAFSVLPALRVTGLGPASALSGARVAGHDLRAGRAHGVLVTVQVALSLVLAVSAALLVATFIRLQRYDLGFDPNAVLTLNVRLKAGAAGRDDDALRHRRILEAVEAMPEVAATAFGNVTVLTPGRMVLTLRHPDEGATPAEQEVFAIEVTPGWFETMGVPLQLGRDFSWNDQPRRSLIVNQVLARLFFGARNPVGSRLEEYEVIGVVGDAVYRSAREGAPPTAYLPSQAGYGSLSVRLATGDPERLSGRVIDTIVRTDPDVLVGATPLAAFARATVATERVTAMLAGFFGVLALVLAAVGTYGVMAYSVGRRRAELAVRRALGATGVDITRRVLGRSLELAIAGVVLGTAISIWVSGLLKPLLYGVGPRDPATFAGAAGTLLAVAAAATWLPARRAARIDPAILLREN